MTDHVYKILELTGSSNEGFPEAVQRAIVKAHETVRDIGWFASTRGDVVDGKVAHWQATLTIGFTLEADF